tara:strand:+ start:520 stop:1002 length:483 start_codon:yes stop_codon:yes gene_type:complete
MEHLKTIMEKLDDMKLSEKVMNDGDYKILMDELKSAYDKKDLDKFVRVMKISSSINVFWSDTDGESNLNSNRNAWSHRSCQEGDEDEGGVSDLKTVEVDLNTENTFHTLKIIEDPDGPREHTSSIDWVKNTIKVGCYEKMKIVKYMLNCNETVVYLEDVE